MKDENTDAERVGESGAEAGRELVRRRHLKEGGARSLTANLEEHRDWMKELFLGFLFLVSVSAFQMCYLSLWGLPRSSSLTSEKEAATGREEEKVERQGTGEWTDTGLFGNLI